jgi:hypothetical protein
VSKCAYCSANGDTKLVRDHVVPRARGGPDNAFNIVMACEPCNSAKHDSTAVEWLGERCPDSVREIENRVNAKLKRDFQKRDKKPSRKPEVESDTGLYAFSQRPSDGMPNYIGMVIEERGDYLRLEAIDILMGWAGLWVLSGSIYDVKRTECRLFNDKAACMSTAWEISERICPRRETLA